MGASLDSWSCLAGATAKRSVGSHVTSGRLASDIFPARQDRVPREGQGIWRRSLNLWGERHPCLAYLAPLNPRTPRWRVGAEASGPCWVEQVKTQPWGGGVTTNGKSLAMSWGQGT